MQHETTITESRAKSRVCPCCKVESRYHVWSSGHNHFECLFCFQTFVEEPPSGPGSNDPSRDEIKEVCEEIQAEWSEDERLRRGAFLREPLESYLL